MPGVSSLIKGTQVGGGDGMTWASVWIGVGAFYLAGVSFIILCPCQTAIEKEAQYRRIVSRRWWWTLDVGTIIGALLWPPLFAYFMMRAPDEDDEW
jgi:hypothetical protein